MSRMEEHMRQWRSDILQGVEQVPVLGTPGTIVTYGASACPIIANRSREVILAVAELGKGRLAVFSHDAYTTMKRLTGEEVLQEGLSNLYENLKRWLTRGERTDDTAIVDAFEITEHTSQKAILVWSTLNTPRESIVDQLVRFVQDGGALIVGMTPWGFLQLRPSFTLQTMPMNVFIQRAGLAFTDGYLSSQGTFHLKDNWAHLSHLGYFPAEGVDDLCEYSDLFRQLEYIPKEDFAALEDRLLSFIDRFKDCVHHAPSAKRPVREPQGKALVHVISAVMQHTEREDQKIPSVESFPGDATPEHELQCAELTIEAPSHGMHCYHPTGYYVPASRHLVVKLAHVPPGSSSAWKVVIGAHSDNLSDVKEPWRRWPCVQVSLNLQEPTSVLHTPSGGLVYFVGNKTTETPLVVQLENVLEAPIYDLTDAESRSAWAAHRRHSPGPWADLIGEHIMLTVPSTSVRQLEDPAPLLQFWDKVVRGHFWLVDVDVGQRRREWIVTDEQPAAGYMHSGYPIVTGLDVANPTHNGPVDVSLVNLEGLQTKGTWGLFHELGHNVQDPMWTFEGTVEVTCNIFTLYAMETLVNQKPWLHKWLLGNMSQVEKYLKGGANFTAWQNDPGVGIFVYAQLARDFGWEAFHKVFECYHELPPAERPTSLQEKVCRWISCFSQVANHNLCPVFEFWGFPITDELRACLGELPGFLPEDETTSMVPERTQTLRRKYNIKSAECVQSF